MSGPGCPWRTTTESASGWPAWRASAGFGSNVSTWLTPPLMKSEMTAFARGSKWGGPRCERVAGQRRRAGLGLRRARREQPLAAQQVGERQAGDAAARLEEEVAPRPERLLPAVVVAAHRRYLRYRNSFRLSITCARASSPRPAASSRAMAASAAVGGRVSAMR